MLKSLLKEPLVHFLALGLVIFAVYHVLNGPDAREPDKIVVSQARIEQLGGLFAKTWQRPPTAQEFKALIDDYVKEEILYREALALGLDKHDTVVRRRLRQKMEFLSDAAIAALSPGDAELETYLKANPAKFEITPRTAFEQIYLNPERRGDDIDDDAASLLEVLNSPSAPTDPLTHGDTTMLPSQMELTSSVKIAQTFGPQFAEAMDGLPPGGWTGPVKSTFGTHLVRINKREPGRLPSLSKVRDAVKREWAAERRRELEDERFAELLKRYDISIEQKAAAGALAEPIP